jgi:hypothetical protein
LGKVVREVAFFAALVQTAVAAYVDYKKAEDAGEDKKKGFGILDPLKGVLEALAKLPGWVTIFLAGLALLWISGGPPGWCAPH